jgi:hypothetical protein
MIAVEQEPQQIDGVWRQVWVMDFAVENTPENGEN